MWLGFLVGWHPGLCEQTLNDGSVSRHHRQLGPVAGALFIEDLQYLNVNLLDSLGRLTVTATRLRREEGL